MGEKGKKEIKIRKRQDGLLLVVAARIYGKEVRAWIDSGATRCFVTSACGKAVGLKGTQRDIFPELGNGESTYPNGMFLTFLPSL